MTDWQTYLQFVNTGCSIAIFVLIWSTSRTYRKTYQLMSSRLDRYQREILWQVYRSLGNTGQIVLPSFEEWADAGHEMWLPDRDDEGS